MQEFGPERFSAAVSNKSNPGRRLPLETKKSPVFLYIYTRKTGLLNIRHNSSTYCYGIYKSGKSS